MFDPTYRLRIRENTVEPGTSAGIGLVKLSADLSLNPISDEVAISIGESRQLKVAENDRIDLELGYKNRLTKVFSGRVEVVHPTLKGLEIKALNSAAKLLRVKLDKTFERSGQRAGDIVSELAREVGILVEKAEKGIELPVYVVDSSRSVYQHIRILAEKCDHDFYFTADDGLVFSRFGKMEADHTFDYGVEIISSDVAYHEPESYQVTVYGESPMSTRGMETVHWLVKSFYKHKGQAGSGKIRLLMADNSVRNQAAAGEYSKAQLRRIQKRFRTGTVKVVGKAEVKLGDAIQIRGAPRADGIYQVQRIRHLLDKLGGFVTIIDWMNLARG